MANKWLHAMGVAMALCLTAAVSRAEVAPDPYAVSVPVAAQGNADLQRAAAQGLRELAQRLTGRSDLDNNAALNAAYTSADRYLEQYRYERNAADSAGAPWLAQLRFSAAAVNQLLRGAGLGGNAEIVELRVSGISNFADYAGLLNYLARLALVKTANPLLMAGDEITLQLKIQGSVEQLVRQLALESQLAPAALESPITETAPAPALQYRWSARRG